METQVPKAHSSKRDHRIVRWVAWKTNQKYRILLSYEIHLNPKASVKIKAHKGRPMSNITLEFPFQGIVKKSNETLINIYK
jgi:hypothetical protein